MIRRCVSHGTACLLLVIVYTTRIGALPPVVTSLPRFVVTDKGILACVTVVLSDETCVPMGVTANTTLSLHTFADIRRKLQHGTPPRDAGSPYTAASVEVIYPLWSINNDEFSGLGSSNVCTDQPVLMLACVSGGAPDDIVSAYFAHHENADASVTVREQRCDALVVEVTKNTPAQTVAYGMWLPFASTASLSYFYGLNDIWTFANASSVRRTMPRALHTWHTYTQLSVLTADGVTSFVLPPPLEDCNDTYYSGAVERLRMQEGLSRFHFEWKHARPNLISMIWAFILASYQMGLCLGCFTRHRRVFLIMTLLLMSVHIPLVGHITLDVYIASTCSALLVPFLVGPILIASWFCSHPVSVFKLPDREVVDNVFLCLLVILLHGMFLLVSVLQETE